MEMKQVLMMIAWCSLIPLPVLVLSATWGHVGEHIHFKSRQQLAHCPSALLSIQDSHIGFLTLSPSAGFCLLIRDVDEKR